MQKGLSCRFVLDNGKFQLTGGGEKASDNVFLIMNYTFLRMIYYPDFNPGIAWLSQKPTSYLNAYKTLLLGNIKRSVQKYVSGVNIDTMAMFFDYSDRKSYVVYTAFTFTEPGKSIDSFNVTFI